MDVLTPFHSIYIHVLVLLTLLNVFLFFLHELNAPHYDAYALPYDLNEDPYHVYDRLNHPHLYELYALLLEAILIIYLIIIQVPL
jgi:hypothetical protein